MKLFFTLLIVVGIVVGVIYSLDWTGETSAPPPIVNQETFDISQAITQQQLSQIATNTKLNNMPETVLEKNKNYAAKLITDVGDIYILLSSSTPITSNNFAFLSLTDYYNKSVFHRVIKDFMIQGGDPTGTGTGNPGYQFNDEPFTGDYTRGTVAMANAGPNTNGSQFFIVQADQPNLPKDYVIFGHVVKGMEVVDKIGNAAVKADSRGEKSSPIKPVSIQSVQIMLVEK